MTNVEVLELLKRYRACKEAQEWAEEHGGPLEDLWRDCERGDWLLWLAAKAGVDRRTVVTAGCACARTALQYVPAGEERPRRAIETAEAWARGEVGRAAVQAAVHAAEDAAFATAGFASAACAASAADYAASAAAYAGYAATYAEAAGYAATYAATAAHADGGELARDRALADCAELVRAHISAAGIETTIRMHDTD